MPMGGEMPFECPDLAFGSLAVEYLAPDEERPIAPRGGVGLRPRVEGLVGPRLDSGPEHDDEQERDESEDYVESDREGEPVWGC